MKVLISSLCLVAAIAADKSFPSDARHVIRVGRNGRQVIHGSGAQVQGAKVRKVVRKQRKQRKERQFIPAAPLTFNIPPPPAPLAPAPASTLRLAPAPLLPQAPVRVAPLVQPAPAVRFAPVPVQAPVVPFVHHAPALRVAPAAAHLVQHSVPAPAPVIAPPAPVIAPVISPPAPVIAPAPAVAPVIEPEVIEAKAVPVPLEYGAPSTVAPEVRNTYLAPEPEVEVEEARAVETGYLGPAVEEARDVNTGYLAPVQEVTEVTSGYLSPAEAAPAPVAVEVARDVDTGYLAPADSYIAVPAPEPVVEAKNTYIAALPSEPIAARVPNVKAAPKQIAIVRNVFNPPSINPAFDYSYEAENGIKAEAVGTMRRVDDTDVAVMKGSYSYVGADGQVYTVDWYADETGFHPSAPHLPQPVVPNHPEVAAAVRAQIAFAAEEDAAAAASRASGSYLAPEELPGYNY